MKIAWWAFVYAIVAIGLSACSRQIVPPSEGEEQARALLAQTFSGSKEYWFAVEKPLGFEKCRLVQLHNPQISFSTLGVTETDQMNGITERCRLVVECDQSRSWDGVWSYWKDDTAGKAQILNFIGPGVGYWVIRFEKVDGEWHSKNTFPVHNLVQNQSLRKTLMRIADTSE